MKKITYTQINKLRKVRNNDLLTRMNQGESLTSFSSQNSWFPNRPTIEKDQDAMNKLYCDSKKSVDTGKSKPEKKKKSSLKGLRVV